MLAKFPGDRQFVIHVETGSQGPECRNLFCLIGEQANIKRSFRQSNGPFALELRYFDEGDGVTNLGRDTDLFTITDLEAIGIIWVQV